MSSRSTRREFLRMTALTPLAYGLSPLTGSQRRRNAAGVQSPRLLFVGTYTDGDSEGIYRCAMNPETGELSIQSATGGISNPSFLALHPDGTHLYSVSETGEFEGEPGGGVYAFAIEPESHDLRLLNAQRSHGGAPCYVAITPGGEHVLVANYSGGNVAILPVAGDGSLVEASDVAQHEGSSVNERRQQGPHAHCIVLDPSGTRAFAADLGIDQIVGYRITGNSLSPAGNVAVEPGAGPRHFTFHPDGHRAYVINELNSTITAFTYSDGSLLHAETVDTLPDGYTDDNYPADIHLSANGRFLYGSNRGHDSIAVFTIGADDGGLKPVQHVSTGGEWPRNFGIDPSGQFLLVANQRTNNIVVFDIDAETGMLSATGHELEIPSPVCIRFMDQITGG